MGNAALKMKGVDVFYDDFKALWDISLTVEQGDIVSIIGSNGSGKSTLLNTLGGQLLPKTGDISYFGKPIGGLPSYQIVSEGMALVPEGRRVFSSLTVLENLIMGSYPPKSRKKCTQSLEKVYDLFPRLKERKSQMSNTLSGGEQQMLAIGRALMSEPKVLLCDEISLGLAPIIIKGIYQKIKQINELGLTIILVEQDIKRSLKVANYAYVMLEGKIVLEGNPDDLTEDQVKKAYFGI
jgi:branched-chain amino acid transport system ATP-binding protein